MTDGGPPTWPDAGAALGAAGDGLEDLVEVGRGGFAVVYRARQARFGREVAVKVVSATADPQSARRFERECEAMGTLGAHPNIVTVFDAGVAPNGDPYLLMEYLPAGSLEDRLLRDGALPWEEVVDIGIKVAGALQTAHDATILHRDIKPGNVLVSQFGEPCLSDFGLARFHGASTTAGGVSATINHAPPEIFEGGGSSTAADVYSLGSTLFTLLAGRAPFARPGDESVLPIIRRITEDPVPDLRPEGVPDDLCLVVEQAMAKAAGDRPASALAVAEALQGVQRAHGLAVTALRVSRQEAAAVAAELQAAADRSDGGPTVVLGRGDRSPTVTVARADGGADEPVQAEEAEPDPEAVPERRSGRGRIVAVAAALVLVLAGLGAFLALGGDDDRGGAAAPTATTAPITRAEAEADLFDQVNAYRAAQGLDALQADADLQAAAQAHAQEVAAAGELLQTDLEALSAEYPGQYAILQENVLSGSSVDQIEHDAESSTATRTNLEQTDVDSLGVGIAFSDDRQTLWAVEYFGQRLG